MRAIIEKSKYIKTYFCDIRTTIILLILISSFYYYKNRESMPNLYYLVYISRTTENLFQSDLNKILTQAQQKNTSLEVTGLLLYKNGYFIQALEGDQKTVITLFEKIAQDHRHTNVIKILETTQTSRLFANWAMAFRNLDDAETQNLQGFSQLVNDYMEDTPTDTNPAHIQKILSYFSTLK
jgi:Sensors of blue-light using FAD